ncbi:hypothetical protein VNO80_17427 [Phaseolus coccineus]|uniref:Uncharacterized protein n=1 Tax=Phaseolus coccineus TaxID=3886 RepID=A0AAN9MHH4_PHACN
MAGRCRRQPQEDGEGGEEINEMKSERIEDWVLPQPLDHDHIALAKRKKFLCLIHLGIILLRTEEDDSFSTNVCKSRGV